MRFGWNGVIIRAVLKAMFCGLVGLKEDAEELAA